MRSFSPLVLHSYLPPPVELGIQQVDDVPEGNGVVYVCVIVPGKLQAVVHSDARNAQQQLQEQSCADFSPCTGLDSPPSVLFESSRYHAGEPNTRLAICSRKASALAFRTLLIHDSAE